MKTIFFFFCAITNLNRNIPNTINWWNSTYTLRKHCVLLIYKKKSFFIGSKNNFDKIYINVSEIADKIQYILNEKSLESMIVYKTYNVFNLFYVNLLIYFKFIDEWIIFFKLNGFNRIILTYHDIFKLNRSINLKFGMTL